MRAAGLPVAGRLPIPPRSRSERVEAHVLKIGRRSDIVCARIETAEGIHGWGEGTTPPNVQPVVAQIRSFEKLLRAKAPGTSKSCGGGCTSWKRIRWAARCSRP